MTSVAVIGNVNADIVARPVSELPPPGGDLLVDTIEVRVGGAAAITAMVLARLGLAPRLVGAVGDDHLGRLVANQLQDAGVGGDGDVRIMSGVPTGVSICLEGPGRDRTFVSMRGALDRFDAAMVPREVLASDFVLLCGYFTLAAMRGRPAVELLTRARRGGATILLDPDIDGDGWSLAARREIEDLLPLVDGFVPNEHEARGLTGLADPVEAGHALQRLCGGWVVVKLGSQGVAALSPGGQTIRMPIHAVEVRDTTGAGDSFNGGLLFALARGDGWPEALAFASRVASAVVSRPSADRYPSLSDLD
jgi:sugar/nucleoside kinase (ribokinase family)